MTREQALLVDCVRKEPPPPAVARIRAAAAAGIDWTCVASMASSHGVSGLVLNSLTAAKACVPADVIERLTLETVRTTALNLSLTVQLRSLIDGLRARGIPSLAFKGPALAAAAYGHSGARTFCDLDILVPLRALPDVRAFMRAQEYRLSFREHRIFRVYPRAGKDEFFQPVRPGLANIEAHVAIAEWGLAIPFDTDALLARAVPIDTPAGALWTLCAEDTLLVGAVQAMTHHWSELKHVSETDAIGAGPLDWDAVIERAQASRITRILAVGILLAQKLVDGTVPDAVRRVAVRDPEAVRLAEEVAAEFFVPLERRRRSLSKSRLRMRCREHASDRVRYAVRAPLYRLACGVIGALSAGRRAATAAS